MKSFYFAALLAVFLFFCAKGIQSQTPYTPTIQSGLMKKLLSNLLPEIKQPVDENKYQLPSGFENLDNPEILKAGKANQLKFATTDDGQQLDSVITENWNTITSKWLFVMKEELLYDENGNRIFYSSFWWDERTSQWGNNGAKTLYTYDSNGNVTESVFFLSCDLRDNCVLANVITTYDSLGNISGGDRYKYDYQFNSNRKITLRIGYHWNNTTNQWIAFSKDEYTYDTKGNTIAFIQYEWKGTVGKWLAISKCETTYDSYGNNTSKSSYKWNADTNQLNHYDDNMNEYTYNANGNIILLYSYIHYNDPLLSYSYSYNDKYEFTYDASGNQTQALRYTWDANTNKLIFTGKTEKSYDANGNITSSANYAWDEFKSKWVGYLNGGGYSKEEWKYDNNANMILHLSYHWGNGDTTYVVYDKEEYTYNVNGNNTSYFRFIMRDKTSQWIPLQKKTWYYSDHSAAFLPSTPTHALTVYPNPTKDFVVFDLPYNSESATAELYDIQGKKVVQQKLTKPRQIAVGHLPKRLYLYRLTDSKKFYTGKLVVE
jgi:hypothetical protein